MPSTSPASDERRPADQRLVVVTGANGFIGSHLTEELVRQGYSVRAVMREGCDQSRLDGITCEHVGLDYRDAEALRRACAGATMVFHLAARASDWGTHKQFYAANVENTRAVAQAALAAAVPRFVFVSSAVLYGCDSRRNARECDTARELKFDYSRTKRVAEEYLLGLKGMAVIIVRPGDVIGPRDKVVSAPMLQALSAGRLGYVGAGDALFCYTYVGNLVKAIVLAGERGRPGEAYNVSDGIEITYRQLFEEMCANLGCRVPSLHVPFFIAGPVSTILEFIYSVLPGRPKPPLTRYTVWRAGHDCHLSIEKAVRELGYEPELDFTGQIRAVVEWYKAETQTQTPE